MSCLCEKSQVIYSDHITGYVDIEWCPRCGRVVLTDEDEKTLFVPTVASQPLNSAEDGEKDELVEHLTLEHDLERGIRRR